MSFPNVSDVIATTIEKRSKKIADNVLKNNALLAALQEKGKVRPFSGGRLIYEELAHAENGNFSFFSGYDTLPVGAADVLSASEWSIKQAACPVVISGLEQLQNSGSEALIDLMEARLSIAEKTMINNIALSCFSSGTGYGGKEIVGLGALVPTNGATGTVGGIDRATWTFWQSSTTTQASTTSANIQTAMNTQWAKLVRGSDRPNLIVVDAQLWGLFMGSLQSMQRFTNAGSNASLGFPSVDYMGAPVVLDANCTALTALFLNTDYLHFRPHKDRNMVPLAPGKRYSVNQDSECQILAWAGALTMSGSKFQGRLTVTT